MDGENAIMPSLVTLGIRFFIDDLLTCMTVLTCLIYCRIPFY
ncbi:hypothetical protein YPPY72_0450 [Yersinia pestis PY-72]|nr:hypothetical protein YPPY09_0398 [Yersinia pestis PY-09]EIS36914.1 hypothetical protein YPPY54_0368 [Yersinia pestis PY-54]EIS81483.1 hypothetical protein YPPY71_0314 [Yersinia pestis PY-71]EIS83883.1 hypothetical protein YPPY72_0450 [Yersinia pestis PY-72]EIT03108.1 hypothetical protein YPPY89_0428 [Yersinia pestis PY-89]EIT07798.1 hypothetical protein YPPY91_0442 [Yersinia pestis PY-91]EIT51169.1 hypothetical protein YPPY101_0297 [Yersinia pestis PY-101]EIT62582.1 hypothetical protein Y